MTDLVFPLRCLAPTISLRVPTPKDFASRPLQRRANVGQGCPTEVTRLRCLTVSLFLKTGLVGAAEYSETLNSAKSNSDRR